MGAGLRRHDVGITRHLAVLFTLQAGRIVAYVIMGGTAGFAGAGVFDLLLEPQIAARVLNWAAAASLMWIGLTIAGVLPAFVALNGTLATLSGLTKRVLAPARRPPIAGPFTAGLSWGFCPCPMVYGALFTAALSGSALGGATLMAGFGLATLPAVVASSLGLSGLRAAGARGPVRAGLGLAIAGLGGASVYLGWPSLGAFCLTP